MQTADKNKQLFKILFSAAWIDGEIQVEERQYLHQIADQKNLSQDPDIRALLCEAVPVKPEDCYRLVEEYIDDHTNEAEYQELLDAVSHMVYSDSQIETEEAKLLNRLQSLAPESQHANSPFQRVIKSIQKLYKGAITEMN
ncbi:MULTISPECIES: tellurite resistance TerB family protein [Cyanophyceae]|uniref:tellurite resistance TerB family protein n=1 Tax=Cyanophyceae TaxID=3028117 RepID=UPI000C072409|nr:MULTISPECIES: TerB family tellurite resistance protein [Cyanophyceae]QCS49154.1 TerB family tellurite resistance protein [Picosynechococcus sp. PCC 11901]